MDYQITVIDCRSDALVRVTVERVGKATAFARPDMDSSHVVWNRRNRASWQAACRAAECQARGMKAAFEECGRTANIVYATRPLDELIGGHGELNNV